MQTFNVDQSTLEPAYGIHIGRWSQYGDLGSLPFDAMWCQIPADSDSAEDCHPEVELAVVVGGRATFTVDGRQVAAPTGTAVLLQPGERHVIHAHDAPVRILSIYWLAKAAEPAETR